MIEKKSLVLAMEAAQQMSLNCPGFRYYVMDKKGKKATYTGSEWIRRERVLDGWHTYCTFKGGVINR